MVPTGDVADPPEAAVDRVEDRSETRLYNKRQITLVRGDGVYLWDSDGRRYLDAMSNYGVNVLGHHHPEVDGAVRAQLDKLVSCHQSYYSDARAEFEETLIGLLPPALARISFANSGTEANEAAIKFARLATGRRRIVSTQNAYHGRTMGALSVTGVAKYREGFEPLVGECDQIAFDDLDQVRESLAGAAALILESIQGESGVYAPSPGYLRGVREICDETGALLILDEVQTGMGRTGRLFAFEHEYVIPDILTISKGLANGLPMGVTVVTEAVSEKIPAGAHGSTFAGNPLVCAAATVTLRVLTRGELLPTVKRNGERFVQALRTLDHRMMREVRGYGLMVAVELKTRVTPYLKTLQENGILALPAGPRAIRFLPPLVIQPDQLHEIVAGLNASLESRP